MRQAFRRMAALALGHGEERLEFFFGTYILIWGLWNLMPFAEFSLPVWKLMARTMGREGWGLLMLGIGLVQSAAAWRLSWRGRATASLLAGLMWAFIAFSFILSYSRSVGTPLIAYLAIVNLVTSYRNGIVAQRGEQWTTERPTHSRSSS